MSFVFGLAGFLSGNLYFLYQPAHLLPILFLCVLSLILFYFATRTSLRALFALAFFILLFAGMGIRFLFVNHPLPLERFVNQPVSISGVIISEPDIRETRTRVVLAAQTINGEKVPQTNILVSIPRYQVEVFGKEVFVSGTLRKPEDFITDTGRLFEYESYLAKDGIYYTLPFAEFELTRNSSSFSISGILLALKNWYVHGLQRALPEPQSSLAAGITVGAKQSLGEELLEAFRLTGLIHIVVLSGYNVTIVAEAIMRMLRRTPKHISLWVGIFSIVLFVLMTGAGATIVRAGIMAILALIARATHKTYALTRALCIAGGLMLLHNPSLLLHDPSFQLSFIATLGLIHVAPIFEIYFKWITQKFGMREIIAATIGTQVAVLPLLLYLTGTVSFSALPVNVLVLPIVPLAMGLSFLAGITGTLTAGIGMLVGFPAHLLLSYIFWIVSFFEQVPFSAITIPPFPFWVTAVLYLLIALWVYYATSSKRFSIRDQFTLLR